jgi:hypothetical protein
MKTVIGTHRETDQSDSLWRVGITHREGELPFGGQVVAWLMEDGSYSMPANEREARRIKKFLTADGATKAAEKTFSVLRYVAELR